MRICSHCKQGYEFRCVVHYAGSNTYCVHDEFEKELDETDIELSKIAHQGKMENKDINRIRSKMGKDGKWHYQHI